MTDKERQELKNLIEEVLIEVSDKGLGMHSCNITEERLKQLRGDPDAIDEEITSFCHFKGLEFGREKYQGG